MNVERPGDQEALESAVDRAWRGASNESPAPHVDAAILAAARRPARSARAWQPYAAAAAVAGLAFVLVQLMPVREPVRDATEGQDAAAIAPPATAPAKTTSAESAARPAAPPAAPVQAQVLEHAGLAERSASEPAAAAPMAPESWARQIAALHDANDLEGAVAALRAFRLAFPDADRRLPPALQEWAAGVE